MREFEGPIRLRRGPYGDHPEIFRAICKLHKHINEDQVVWCSQDSDFCLHNEVGRYLHEIDAVEQDVVAIVDALVWCHVAGYGERYIPPSEHDELRNKAALQDGDYEEAIRIEEDRYLAEILPKDLWTGVTRDGIIRPSDQVLLRFPFECSSIISVQLITDEMARRWRLPSGLTYNTRLKIHSKHSESTE